MRNIKFIIGTPVGIASASFTLIFSLTTGTVKKLLNITRKKRKNMIKFLCWLNSIVLIHFNISSINWYGISHEEFTTILKEKDKYEMMKENLRNKNGESYEIIV